MEEGTPLYDRVRAGEIALPDEDAVADMEDAGMAFLKQRGYERYEVSNFAKPGRDALHNSGYWARKPYVGLGPSAHSFSGRGRSWNESVLDGYKHTDEALSVEDEKVETLMLGLRTAKGIDGEFLEANCIREAVDRLLAQGALAKVGRRYRIPEDHFFVSDEIIRELI